MSMQKNIKITIFALLALLIIFLSFYFWRVFFNNDVLEVKRGDLIEEIVASGKVVSLSDVSLGFDMDGRVGDILVSVGSKVSAGDVLASLDTSDLKAQLKKKEAEIELEKARFSQFLAGTRSEEVKLFEAQVERAKVDLDSALKNFENTKVKADSDLTQVYQSAADMSDVVLLSAENAMNVLSSIYQPSNRFQTFFFIPNFNKKSDAEWQVIFTRDAFLEIKNGYNLIKKDPSNENIDQVLSTFKINLEIIRLALTKTSDALESASVVFGSKSIESFKKDILDARSDINRLQTDILNKTQAISAQKILNDKNIAEAESLVASKRAILAEKEGELVLKKAEPRDIEVKLFEARIKELEASKYLIEDKIKRSHIIAPVSGVIQEILVKSGETVKANDLALNMALLSDFQIEAELSSDDMKKVKIGDDVKISIKSDKEEYIVEGDVVFVPQKDSDEMKVYIAPRKKVGLELGSEVSLNIDATVKKDIIVLPQKAIISKNNTNKVILLEDGAKREVEVDLGIRSGRYVEVVSGLYVGDRVILP